MSIFEFPFYTGFTVCIIGSTGTEYSVNPDQVARSEQSDLLIPTRSPCPVNVYGWLQRQYNYDWTKSLVKYVIASDLIVTPLATEKDTMCEVFQAGLSQCSSVV